MNLASIKAWSAKNKKPLLGSAAAAAVGFGLWTRSKGGSPKTTTAADITPGSTAPMPNAGGTGYDSSSSDVYNALQPQIEQTQGMLQKLLDALADKPPVPPAVVPPPAAKPPANGNWGINPHYWPRPVTPVRPLPPRVTPPKAPAKPAQRVYIVRKGDNLSTIAARLGIKGGASTGWHLLYNANKAVIGSNANLIRPGQRLVY